MKITKKVTSLLLVMLLALSTFAVAITATAVDLPATPVTVNIHKYTMPQTSETDDPWNGLVNGDGYPIDGSTESELEKRGAEPVQGVEFTFYYVGDLNTAVPSTPGKGLDVDPLTNGLITGTLGEDPDTGNTYTLAGNKNFPTGDTVFTTTTGVGGLATVQFQPLADAARDGGHPFGLYYVVETKKPDYVKADKPGENGKAQPFYIYVPMTDTKDGTPDAGHKAGETYMSTIDVYPKNVFTTNGVAAYKTIDQVFYANALTQKRVYDGAVIELHREGADYDPTTGGSETTVATFTLASVSNTADYTPEDVSDPTYGKTDDPEGAEASLKFVPASVSLFDIDTTKKTVTGTGTDVDSALSQDLHKSVTVTYEEASNRGSFGQEYAQLSATVTNDGRMIVNGLPVGKYHWHEKSFTKLYAQKANDHGAGLKNDYEYWRKCSAEQGQDKIIGTVDRVEITENTPFGAWGLTDDALAPLFTITSGSVVSGMGNTVTKDVTIGRNHIENTIGVQISKETIAQPENGVVRDAKYVSNNDGSVQDLWNNAGHFDYSVGQTIPYRLLVKIPADLGDSTAQGEGLVITDTMDEGLTLTQKTAFTSDYIPEWTDQNPNVLNNKGTNEAPNYGTFGYMVGLANATTFNTNYKLNVTKAVDTLITENIEPDNGKTKVTFTVDKDNRTALVEALRTALKSAGLAGDGVVGTDMSSYVLYIYYEAKLNEKAVVSKSYDEKADGGKGAIDATNDNTLTLQSGSQMETRSSTVSVFTGGAKLKKIDSSTNTDQTAAVGVPGARYKVYKANKEGSTYTKAGDALKFNRYVSQVKNNTITDAKSESGTYVYAENQEDGEALTEITTLSNGFLDITGLEFGAYIVEEVYSPDGFELNSKMYGFDVTKDSYSKTVVDNGYLPDVPTTDLPLTGGMGTIIFTVVGLALIGGAAFFFIRSRRNKEDEA